MRGGRVLGNTPLQVNLELMHTTTHVSKNTPQERTPWSFPAAMATPESLTDLAVVP